MWQRLSRSELLSTFFPTWIWQGREWAKGKVPKYDPYYWINAHSHPVISTYYPFGIFTSVLGSKNAKFKISSAFSLLVTSLGVHVLFGLVGWLMVLSVSYSTSIAIFGATTFILAGYNWKQQPCFQYTVAWFPWILYGIATNNVILAGISLGMMILAGYYPIGVQCGLISLLAALSWGGPPAILLFIPIGLLIGAVQIIPFLRYLPKTIRANKVSDIGKVPWWHFGSLVFPKAYRFNINGVGYWEMSYYVGLVPLMTIWYTRSRAVWIYAFAILLMMGVCGKHLPRIPARFSYTFQFGLIWCAVTGLQNLALSSPVVALLCLIQGYDLWLNNAPLLVNHPYAELYNPPSRAFNTKLTRYLKDTKERISGLPYPLFTGHINELRTIGYCGGMQLKLMAKWRCDTNPDGAGQHDFFKGDGDPHDLERYVGYAYTRQRCDWPRTGLKYLYRSPALNGR